MAVEDATHTLFQGSPILEVAFHDAVGFSPEMARQVRGQRGFATGGQPGQLAFVAPLTEAAGDRRMHIGRGNAVTVRAGG